MEKDERRGNRLVHTGSKAARLAIAGYRAYRQSRRREAARRAAELVPLPPEQLAELRGVNDKVTGLLKTAAEQGFADDDTVPTCAMWFSRKQSRLLSILDLPAGRRHVSSLECVEEDGHYYMTLPAGLQDPREPKREGSLPRYDLSWGVERDDSSAFTPTGTRVSAQHLSVEAAIYELSATLAAEDLVPLHIHDENRGWDSRPAVAAA